MAAPAAQAGGITGSAATAAAEAQTPPPPGPPVFEAADRAHILGLQGNIWTEHIRTQERVETMAFPRAAAVAEAAWSSPANRDWDDFLTRLPAEFDRFAGVGLTEDESLFAVELKADPDSDRNVSVALANPPQPEHSHLAVAAPPLVPSPIGGAPILTPPPIPIVAAPDPPPDHPLLGQIHYALGARTPLASAPAYQAPIRVALPATLSAATFVGGRRISPTLDRRLDALSVRRRVSQELILCTDKLTLNLEGDPQPQGDRSVFLVDIMNPCWIWPAAPLTDIGAVSVGVGALPFNFQIGVDLKKIILRPPSTPQGELQVHLDGCAGALIASLPLAPASVRPGVTTLTADLPPLQGPHALCFEFTARRVDPLWAVAWVQLVPRAAPAKAP